MSTEEFVSVLIVDQVREDKGIIANASFVLGLTAGRMLSDSTFGHDMVDGEGSHHAYLTNIGHMVRKAGQNKMRELRKKFFEAGIVKVIDYTEDAAPADYATYASALASHKGEEITYRALYVYGPATLIIPLTKNLSRLS